MSWFLVVKETASVQYAGVTTIYKLILWVSKQPQHLPDHVVEHVSAHCLSLRSHARIPCQTHRSY